MDEYEELLMKIIANSGEAHSCGIDAIRKARAKDYYSADALMNEGREALMVAHEAHFGLLQSEAAGSNKLTFTFLMTHAQDHLMNAQTVCELATEIIELCKERQKSS